MSLYPTPTRLALLADVDAGEVWQRSDGQSELTDRDQFGVSDPVCIVTSRIAELERAGWVHLVELAYGSRQWQLTDAGRAVLAGEEVSA